MVAIWSPDTSTLELQSRCEGDEFEQSIRSLQWKDDGLHAVYSLRRLGSYNEGPTLRWQEVVSFHFWSETNTEIAGTYWVRIYPDPYLSIGRKPLFWGFSVSVNRQDFDLTVVPPTNAKYVAAKWSVLTIPVLIPERHGN